MTRDADFYAAVAAIRAEADALRADVARLTAERDALEKQNADLRAFAIYWLRRAYDAIRRQGWEEGPSDNETAGDIHGLLWDAGHHIPADVLPWRPVSNPLVSR